MDAETFGYFCILLSLLAIPCIQYKVNEWKQKRYAVWYRRNVMMEEWGGDCE